MINNALIAISGVPNGLFVNNANQYYFYYDPITQLYFASLGMFGVYILYRVMVKNGMLPNI